MKCAGTLFFSGWMPVGAENINYLRPGPVLKDDASGIVFFARALLDCILFIMDI
jgi:hypothetical protein